MRADDEITRLRAALEQQQFINLALNEALQKIESRMTALEKSFTEIIEAVLSARR